VSGIGGIVSWGSISCALSVSETKGNSIAVAAFAQIFLERRDNNIAVACRLFRAAKIECVFGEIL